MINILPTFRFTNNPQSPSPSLRMPSPILVTRGSDRLLEQPRGGVTLSNLTFRAVSEFADPFVVFTSQPPSLEALVADHSDTLWRVPYAGAIWRDDLSTAENCVEIMHLGQ